MRQEQVTLQTQDGPYKVWVLTPEGTGSRPAVIDYLDTRSDVAGKKVGTVGFCVGGGMALRAAAYPDRVAAAVSFHGGRLATDLKQTS